MSYNQSFPADIADKMVVDIVADICPSYSLALESYIDYTKVSSNIAKDTLPPTIG